MTVKKIPLIAFLYIFFVPLISFGQDKGIFVVDSSLIAHNEVINLNGEWQFFPSQFVNIEQIKASDSPKDYLKVPGYWDGHKYENKILKGKGYATYYLRLVNHFDTQKLTIHVGQLMTAFKLFYNGQLIAENGTITKEKTNFKPGFFPTYKNIILEKGENHLVLQVSNFAHRHGGIFDPIEIGSAWAIFIHKMLRLAYDFVLFGALLFMSIYHFALFSLRRKDKSVLLFAFFSLLMGLRTIFTGGEAISYLFPHINFSLSYRIEYLSFYVATPLFGYFLYSIFSKTVKLLYLNILSVITTLFVFSVVFFPLSFFNRFVISYQLITLVYIIYYSYEMIRNIILKIEGAVAISLGALVFFLCIVNDMLDVNMIIRSTELAPLGLFIFMFSQSYLLSLRFSKAFIHNEELSAELDYKNKNLESIVQKRTAEIQQQKEEIQTQSELLAETNKELEKLSIVASETDNAVTIFNEKLNIEWVNLAFERLYGYSLDEFKQKKGVNLLETTANKRIKEQIEALENSQKSISYESSIEDKLGQKKWIQTTLTPVIDKEGNIFKVVAIDSDITQIKLAEQEILQRNEEINAQKEKLVLQNRKIEIQNQNINASISYAKDIQQAILPIDSNLQQYFEHFVIYKPKDIVSGDLYWFSEIGSYVFLAVIDCTGHGVPGAFMSMIANRLISSVVNEQNIFSPAEILKHLDLGVSKALKQDQTENKDGMDVCLIRLDKQENNVEMIFAGAKRSLIYYDGQKKEIRTIKGDRTSIGGITERRKELNFTNKGLSLKKGDILYLSSDGYIDQNNTNRKRFGTKRLMILLREIAHLDMNEQRSILLKVMQEFQGSAEQRDDITLLVVKL